MAILVIFWFKIPWPWLPHFVATVPALAAHVATLAAAANTSVAQLQQQCDSDGCDICHCDHGLEFTTAARALMFVPPLIRLRPWLLFPHPWSPRPASQLYQPIHWTLPTATNLSRKDHKRVAAVVTMLDATATSILWHISLVATSITFVV